MEEKKSRGIILEAILLLLVLSVAGVFIVRHWSPVTYHKAKFFAFNSDKSFWFLVKARLPRDEQRSLYMHRLKHCFSDSVAMPSPQDGNLEILWYNLPAVLRPEDLPELIKSARSPYAGERVVALNCIAKLGIRNDEVDKLLQELTHDPIINISSYALTLTDPDYAK